MQNNVWEKVITFLNRLRCENVSRDSSIIIPEYEDKQKELERFHEKCEKMMQHMPKEEQQVFRDWGIKSEEMISLEGQKAYCQGYVDCVLLLSGLGLFQQDISPEEFIKKIK